MTDCFAPTKARHGITLSAGDDDFFLHPAGAIIERPVGGDRNTRSAVTPDQHWSEAVLGHYYQGGLNNGELLTAATTGATVAFAAVAVVADKARAMFEAGSILATNFANIHAVSTVGALLTGALAIAAVATYSTAHITDALRMREPRRT